MTEDRRDWEEDRGDWQEDRGHTSARRGSCGGFCDTVVAGFVLERQRAKDWQWKSAWNGKVRSFFFVGQLFLHSTILSYQPAH